MTGKEALRILCECANGEKKLLFSDSLDLERIISKRLEKLEKLEKVFEIFKRLDSPGRALLIAAIFDIATDEEYELLEELMKSE